MTQAQLHRHYKPCFSRKKADIAVLSDGLLSKWEWRGGKMTLWSFQDKQPNSWLSRYTCLPWLPAKTTCAQHHVYTHMMYIPYYVPDLRHTHTHLQQFHCLQHEITGKRPQAPTFKHYVSRQNHTHREQYYTYTECGRTHYVERRYNTECSDCQNQQSPSLTLSSCSRQVKTACTSWGSLQTTGPLSH